jgi:hypothetical protein
VCGAADDAGIDRQNDVSDFNGAERPSFLQ